MLSLFQSLLCLLNLLLFVIATPEQLGIQYDELETHIYGEAKRYFFHSRLTFPNTKDVFVDVLKSDRGQASVYSVEAIVHLRM